MADYQLELRQIVDYPRCRIYREFTLTLITDRNIRTGGCSGLFYYVVLCAYANFRTSYRRIDGISYTVYPGEWICSITDITEWFRVRFHYQAFAILKSLQDRQLITFTRLGRGHIVKFSITDWQRNNTALDYNCPCQKDSGFFFIPVSTATELISAGRASEMDVILDLWISAIYKLYSLSDTGIQYGRMLLSKGDSSSLLKSVSNYYINIIMYSNTPINNDQDPHLVYPQVLASIMSDDSSLPNRSPYNEKKLHFNIGRWLYAAFLTTTLTASLCLSASAATVWEKANEIMKDVYKQILGISTIAAIVTAAVALLMMNFSRSGRTVDESRAWLKRIIITWAVLNGLGFIMSYVTPFFSGGQWTAP